MKFIFIFILIVILQNPSYSQEGFYYQHIKPMDSKLFDVVEGEDGYLSVGVEQTNKDKGFLLFINKNGVVEWEKKINFQDTTIISSVFMSVVYAAPYFYAIGIAQIDSENKYLVTKIDAAGEILFSKILETPHTFSDDNYPSKALLNGETILIAGSAPSAVGTRGELLRIDLDANILWQKMYNCFPNSTLYSERIVNVKKTVSNNYLLEIYCSNFNGKDVSVIISIDNEGNELWRKKYDTLIPSSHSSDSLVLLSATPYKENNTIVLFVVANADQYSSTSYPREDFALIEYNEFGEEIKYKRFYNPTALVRADIQTKESDELFILGSKEYGEIEGYHLGLIKLNSHKEIEWEKFYKKENPLDTLIQAGPLFENGKLTSDNGFIMVAYDFYFEFGGAYFNPGVLKLDCVGDTTWNYNNCLSPNFDEVTLFPNPFSDNFIIQLPNLPAQSVVETKVYDVSGRLIGKSKFIDKDILQINGSDWANGVYNCVLFINGQYLNTKKIIKK